MTYHMDAEDIMEVQPEQVRRAWQIAGIEVIPHYVTINVDTNVVFVYPEVCCEDRGGGG